MISQFHHAARSRPGVTIASDEWVRHMLPERHALFSGRPTPFSLTPYLIPATYFLRLRRICENLAEIMEEAGHVILQDETLIDLYRFPPFFLEMLRVNPGYDRLAPVLRLDGHFVRGVFRIVETNADGSAGMNDSNTIERSAAETPIFEFFRTRASLRSCEMLTPLARMLLRHSCAAQRRGLSGRIAILDIPGVSTESEFLAVKYHVERLGGKAGIVAPRDLAFHQSSLTANGRAIGVVYRRLVTRDAWECWDALKPLVDACARGRVRLVGSFRSEILHNKALLAALNDPRLLCRFPPAARRLLTDHIPRAFILTPDAAKRAAQTKDRWVLKPLDAYGSRDVSIGRNVSRSKWKRILTGAVNSRRFLLQEYVPAHLEPVLRVVDGKMSVAHEMTSVGFFLYDGKMAGPYVRSGPVHPLSISRGAVTRPGFVITP